MACSLWSERKCPTWSIALYFLTLFVGFMLVEITYAHDQEIIYAEDQEIFMSNNDTASGLVIGIDFGTSYFRAGIMKDGMVDIIVDDQGYRATPSWVAFADGEHLVGEAAKNQAASNPLRTIFDIKRLIGRRFDETSVQNDIKYFPFQVINKDGQPHISVPIKGEGDDLFTPEEILAMILGTIKDNAEKYLGEPVKDAIITVPTYFTDTQRAATKDAGTIAGLNILRVVNETTAAAVAYGLHKLDAPEHHTLVYDLGSTFGVAIIVVEDGVFDHLFTAGDPHLGGEDFNNRVVSYLTEIYNKANDFDIAKDANSMERLKREVEKAKHNLSFLNSTDIEIESFHKGSRFSETLTRAQFEALNNDLFKKTLESVNEVLKEAKMKKSDIDDFIIVGGSAHIPKVQKMLEEYFGKKSLKDINPEEATVMGAAILGAVIYGDGGSDDDLIGHECGCAWGISPLSLGIETADGTMSRLINRATIIPTKKSQIFSTTADNQSIFVVKIFQGERFMAKDNHKLAEFELTNIALAPRGVPQIEVTFELDVNRTLKVSAIDIDSGKFKSINITGHNQISNEDVDNIVEEAEKYAEEELANRERIESRNKIINYVYNLESKIKDNKGLNEKQPLLDALKKTQDWLSENAAKARVEDFEEQLQKLSDASSFIASKASCSKWWYWWC